MRRLVFPVVLVVAFTLVPYVRRGVLGRPSTPVLVIGSRDRTLPGKARVRARRMAVADA